ncbi:hypothetical protein KGM_201886 [Danaus plexippus plexippus]|uniref:Lysosome-associated membrane glycoprotein 5 n=1 Tax=Danaus plexippus plexippus TaxID=278856 RepID=A0A212F3E3_DANPL|nr:hypothetical protein KGM_201886 [Danaus plexippus plexippus]
MIRLRFYLVWAVVCSSMVFCQGSLTPPKPVVIPVPVPSLAASPAVSSAASEEPKISTEIISTTTKPSSEPEPTTTTPTTPPTTTSTTPSTTTPTTPPTTPPTTTPTPTTTTPTPPPTPPPAPTPAPGPLPPPQQGTWSWTDKNNVTCILIKFAAQLNVTYPIDNSCQGSLTPPKPVVIPVPVPSLAASPAVSSAASEEPKISTEIISTTTKPSSEPEPTTTTPTTPPTTTSTTPSTTTPTTPPTTPPTTTPTPTTTTPTPPPTPPPAPTPAPGPLPPPQQGTWSWTDKNNVTCILIKFAAQLNVTYPIDNSSSPLGHLVMNVPSTAVVVNGSCDGSQQWVNITWPVWDKPASPMNSMLMVFANNATTKLYSLEHLNLLLMPEVFPNASSEMFVHWQGSTWRTPQATSYRCSPPTQLNLTADAVNQVATLTLTQLQEEAFRTSGNSSQFSALVAVLIFVVCELID